MNTQLYPDHFRELPLQRQQEINGGILPFLVAIGIAATAEIIRDWDNFKNGITGQPEEKE